jgi:hypothetical protein
VHDNNGNPLTKLPLCVPDQPPGSVPIIGLDWYHGLEGYADPNAPTLALAFENGKIQVGKHKLLIIFLYESLISVADHPPGSVPSLRCTLTTALKSTQTCARFREWQESRSIRE